MKERTTRNDALRSLSALGAGVLLAVTPHCGGKSEGASDDSGGSGNDRGGASGSAGTYDGPGMYGGGGYGGVGTTGGYGGVGIGGYGGTCGTARTVCYTPDQLAGCFLPDAGVDGNADDGGTGVGEGGFGGEASELPPSPAAPNPDAGALPDSGFRPPEPPAFACPASPPVPECIENPGPVSGFVSPIGWNGTACCYLFDMGCY